MQPKTHEEVRSEARALALKEFQDEEDERYSRHLTDRISRRLVAVVGQLLREECYGAEASIDMKTEADGAVTISYLTLPVRHPTVIARIRVAAERRR
jgi:hypothetical protein